MPCEAYKTALIEAAASSMLEAELRAHLGTCPTCRSAYDEEQSLFASIDASLRKTANAEIPASLLPRVRAALDAAPAPQCGWTRPLILASASLALALIVFLVASPHRMPRNEQSNQIPGLSAHGAPAAATHHEDSGSGVQIISSDRARSQSRTNSTLLHSAASSQPEVLVPLEERQEFARFVVTVQERNDVAVALLSPAPKKNDALLSVDPLQIADVELKPLEGSEVEISDREGEKH